MKVAEQLSISQLALPRQKRCPARLQEGALPHEYPSPRDFYHHIWFEACDLLIAELEDRFETQHIPTVLSVEQALTKATNGE